MKKHKKTKQDLHLWLNKDSRYVAVFGHNFYLCRRFSNNAFVEIVFCVHSIVLFELYVFDTSKSHSLLFICKVFFIRTIQTALVAFLIVPPLSALLFA